MDRPGVPSTVGSAVQKPVSKGRRLLFPGVPRSDRKRLRAAYRDLEAGLGPFDAFAAAYARIVVRLGLDVERAQADLAATERRRAEGRGRRPHAREVERGRRRVGLAFTTWDAALRRLAELAGGNGHATPPSGDALLAELRRARGAL